MQIVPIEHGFAELLGHSFGSRTPGLHISQIYGGLYEELEPTRFVKGSIPDPLRLEAGLAFESILEEGLKQRLCGGRPGEIVSEEGIICSPDLIVFNGSTRVGEIKLTWMSSREVPREACNSFPPKFSKYFCQMLSYCHVLEVSEAQLIGFFINGKYEFIKQRDGSSIPSGPELLAWNITFTAREIRENWTMLMNYARQRKLL